MEPDPLPPNLLPRPFPVPRTFGGYNPYYLPYNLIKGTEVEYKSIGHEFVYPTSLTEIYGGIVSVVLR